MTQPEIRINLDVHETEAQSTVEIAHLDSSRILKIALTDEGLPYHISDECKAIFVASKEDGTYIINPCTIENDVISYDITSQTTAAPGLVLCEIRLTGGDDDILLTSLRFNIFVVPTIYEGGAVTESKNEFDALSKLITESSALVEEMKYVLENEVLPDVSAADNGKFLRVANGVWAAVNVPAAEEAQF